MPKAWRRPGVNPSKVSAVIVTRGDVDLTAIRNSLLPFGETIVWDNSEREDRSCYGRFAAAREAKHDLVYFQDDDVLCGWPGLLNQWEGRDEVLASRPPVEPWRFLGVGALAPRRLIVDGWDERFLAVYPGRADFDRVSDVVFGYQHLYRPCWVGYAEMDWSRWENRMYHDVTHIPVRERAVARVEQQGWLCPEVGVTSP